MIEIAIMAGLGYAIRALRSDGPASRRIFVDGASPGAPPTSSFDGIQIAASLPEKAGSARENALLALAESGQIPTPLLTAVTYMKGGHSVEIFPSTDALMLGTDRPVRLTARHTTAQRLADFFGMVLPTSLMSDQAWLAATKIAPLTGLQGPNAGDTATFVTNSQRVDAAVSKAGVVPGVLVRPTGKDWVNTERLLQANGSVTRSKDDPGTDAVANFGWHQKGAQSRSPGGLAVIQSVGLVHNLPFVDYSQVVTLYGPTVIIDDGAPENVVDVLRDPERAFLLSDEVGKGQAARVVRHPDVPLEIA